MALLPEEIWNHIDSLTKPPRSLGRLEDLAARLCLIQQSLAPVTRPRRLVLFAADHGVAEAGVTMWPSAVTGLMVQAIRSGKAASTVLADQGGAETVLLNLGVRDTTPSDDLPDIAANHVRYRDVSFLRGTRNLAEEPALTADEFSRAVEIGRSEAQAAAADGMRVVIAGEMGIGNTTPAACLAMLLGEVPLAEAVGRGAGATDAILNRKRDVVERAVERSRRIWARDPLEAIAAVAGLEIAAMAGFFMSARSKGLTVVLDGYVTGSAALIAEHLQPGTADALIAAHLSEEPGHRGLLDHLGLTPFLDWRLRLGEGTGALLLLPLLDAAAAMVAGMATLDSLGIAPGGRR